MGNINKIAVCFTGETRSFNNSQATLNTWIRGMNAIGYDYEFFGSTWDHCDIPFNHNDLSAFSYLNQDSIINDDLFNHEHFFNVIYYNKSKTFKDLFAQHGYDFIKYANRLAYGQIYSAYHSFLDVKNKGFDLIIKARWDSDFLGTVPTDPVLINNIKVEWEYIKNSPHATFGFFLPLNDDIAQNILNDIVVVSNNQGVDYLTRTGIANQLFDFYVNTNCEYIPSAHKLWEAWVLHNPRTGWKEGIQSNNTELKLITDFAMLVAEEFRHTVTPPHPIYPPPKDIGI